jgi:hypothetical protein
MEVEKVEEPIHPGVELLLARMDSHPEEFATDMRWAYIYQQVKSHWNGTEKKLFNAKMRKIRMRAMHANLMKELLK